MGIQISSPDVQVDDVTIMKTGATISIKNNYSYVTYASITSIFETTSNSYQDVLTLSTPKSVIASQVFLIEATVFGTSANNNTVSNIQLTQAGAELINKDLIAPGISNGYWRGLKLSYLVTVADINTQSEIKLKMKSDGSTNSKLQSAELKISYYEPNPNP